MTFCKFVLCMYLVLDRQLILNDLKNIDAKLIDVGNITPIGTLIDDFIVQTAFILLLCKCYLY